MLNNRIEKYFILIEVILQPIYVPDSISGEKGNSANEILILLFALGFH